MSQKNFFDFNFESLKLFLNKDLSVEEKKISMRGKQIWQSVYKKGSFEINNLTPLPLELRNKLKKLIRSLSFFLSSNGNVVKQLISNEPFL